jgi:hypothetical protein
MKGVLSIGSMFTPQKKKKTPLALHAAAAQHYGAQHNCHNNTHRHQQQKQHQKRRIA